MNYIINHLKLSAKTYTILFMCLCGMILLIVNFEARVLVKLSIPWDSIVSDVTLLEENSSKALQTSMKENSIAPLKPCQRNTFLGKCYVDWLQSLKQFFTNVSYHILLASLTLMALF